MDHCNDDYVTRMDSDDTAINTRIALRVKFTEADRDMAGCGAWGRSFGGKGGLMKYPLEDKQTRDYFPFNSSIIYLLLLMRHSFMKEHFLRYDFRFVAEGYKLVDRAFQIWWAY